ncbi:MAG: glycosyltransferase [Muribaculaceae bacterium]|nr:glycosyltransferase [Muribaculaceae bacterium]
MTGIPRYELKETMRNHGICMVLPTYNNVGTLARVIADVKEYCDDIIVVNDGSTDSTERIINSFGDTIYTVSYNKNQGKGEALKRGFNRAKELGFRYAITIDTDGQHYASDIPAFVKAIIEYPDSLIIGARDLSGVDINGKSSFANKFSNFWFTVQTGKRLTDTQTGYRAYPLHKLHGLSILTSRYEAELELLVFAAWNGVNIHSIPIKVYYPPRAERISHFRPGLDFTRISILNTILCIAAVVYGVPARIISSINSKSIFHNEWKVFTHKKGERKEASTTLGRLARSVYGLSFFLFWSLLVFTPYAIISLSLGKPTEKKRMKLHRMLQRISQYIVSHYPGGKTKYENPSNEDYSKPAIIISNHQSILDLPLMMSISPKIIFLTNDWVWENRYFGKIIQNAEFLPASHGIDNIIPKLKDLRDRGYSIMIFPEGTRSHDCRINRFHQGAFHIARELQLDILPMVIHGAGHYLPKRDFMFRKGLVTLKTIGRFEYEENSDRTLLKEASQYRKIIHKAYSDIQHRVETAEYFKSLVLYKYAWRGWRVVRRCKSVLRQQQLLSRYIDAGMKGNIQILNSGFGVFAIWFALVNKEAQIYTFEENLKEYKIAAETGGIPENLHILHSVWPYERNIGIDFQTCFQLNGPLEADPQQSNVIILPLKS